MTVVLYNPIFLEAVILYNPVFLEAVILQSVYMVKFLEGTNLSTYSFCQFSQVSLSEVRVHFRNIWNIVAEALTKFSKRNWKKLIANDILCKI